METILLTLIIGGLFTTFAARRSQRPDWRDALLSEYNNRLDQKPGGAAASAAVFTEMIQESRNHGHFRAARFLDECRCEAQRQFRWHAEQKQIA